MARGASAQGLFYAEETKDGRIYVFNIKDNWERFKASGETGTGLTRLGVGPERGDGLRRQRDGPGAVLLQARHHRRPWSGPRSAPQRIEWRDGKTRFTLGDNFYLEMSNRIQPRFTYEMPDDSVQLAGTGGRGDCKPSFRIRRAKFKLEGWFYKPSLEYELQLNWTDVVNTPASQFLEDANIDWDLSKKKNKAFRVKLGQFKAPFGRQQLTSSGAQQFVDRAIQDARVQRRARDRPLPVGHAG